MSEEATTDTQTQEAQAETTESSTLGGATTEAETATEAGATEQPTETTEGATEATEEKAEEATVPEAYDLKIVQTVEGKEVEMELDKGLLDEATPLLKDAGLTNDQANKLAPLAVKIQERLAKAQADAFAETRAQWAKEAQADPEMGGKKWKETTTLAAKAMDKFIGPVSVKDDKGNEVRNPFRQLLDETGLGEHPAMIRAFRDIGAAVAEDSTFARSSDVGAKVKKSPEENLYPDDVPKK